MAEIFITGYATTKGVNLYIGQDDPINLANVVFLLEVTARRLFENLDAKLPTCHRANASMAEADKVQSL